MRRIHVDVSLLVYTVLLLGIGLLSVYSASSAAALHAYGDAWYDTKRQLLFACMGVVAMWVAMRVPIETWKRWATPLLIAALIALIAVLIPGIGVVRGGARSWLGIGSFGIQPSEFMKIALIVFLARGLSQQHVLSWRALFVPLSVIGAIFALVMLQPDLGTGAVLCGAAGAMLVVAGMRAGHMITLGLCALAGGGALIAVAPYRLKRLTAFVDPWSDALGAGYQTIQSLFALAPGGLIGVGFGQSIQKHSYLPEPQTDFIFAIWAEEWGWIGAVAVLVLYALLIVRGWTIALRLRDAFASLLASGITAMWTVQVVINVGVVIGLLPVTGITLPLMSAGGSSLVLLLASLGMLHQLAASGK
ncbi:MAG: putative lipid II flippase FtsW [Paenibacillaceae bacterium]|nr:putative lipid II flippase FtsW [Paenibacillaceae bacterium]